jgi:hypothetical protein
MPLCSVLNNIILRCSPHLSTLRVSGCGSFRAHTRLRRVVAVLASPLHASREWMRLIPRAYATSSRRRGARLTSSRFA